MRLTVVLTILWASLNVQADILHLRDGSRHHGTLLKQTKTEIVFRIALADGASAVRTFPAARVLRVERTAFARPDSARARRDEPEPATSTPDYSQMLREAYELVDDGDLLAGLRALQRVVTGAPGSVLRHLDRQVKDARGIGLDEFIASTRIRAALEGGRGRLFDLKPPTRYETRALAQQLARLRFHLVKTRYHGRFLESWARNRDDYTELHPDARHMVADVRLAAAVISARLRYTTHVELSCMDRGELASLRDDLMRFAAKVSAMPGFTGLGIDDTDENDPTLREARRLVAEQAATTRPANEPPAPNVAP
jgi:hypothetical protein